MLTGIILTPCPPMFMHIKKPIIILCRTQKSNKVPSVILFPGIRQSTSSRNCTTFTVLRVRRLGSGLRRFTRLTNAFSKKLENLKAAVTLYFAWYNFVRCSSDPASASCDAGGDNGSHLDSGRVARLGASHVCITKDSKTVWGSGMSALHIPNCAPIPHASTHCWTSRPVAP